MTTRSVRTQLLLGIGGVVMLTVLLFAAAVWRLILLPAENEPEEKGLLDKVKDYFM